MLDLIFIGILAGILLFGLLLLAALLIASPRA